MQLGTHGQLKRVRITLAFKERLIEITELEPMLQAIQDSPASNENEDEEEKEDDFDDNEYLDEIDPKELFSNDVDLPLPQSNHYNFSKSSAPIAYTPKGIKSDFNVSYISNTKDRNIKFKKCEIFNLIFYI